MATTTNQNTLIFTLIVLLGTMVGYLYYSKSIVPAEQLIAAPTVSNDDLRIFENINLDFSVLNNNKYKSLQKFGESPVNPGVTGKKDIFAPI